MNATAGVTDYLNRRAVEVNAWLETLVPWETVAPEQLHRAMRSAVRTHDTSERLYTAGLEPAGGTGAELLELIKRDIPRFRGIIQNIGIQPE